VPDPDYTDVLALIADGVELDRELIRRGGFRAFVRLAWHLVESVPMIPGWHIDLICRHLEAVYRGDIDRLVINIPPSCMKSKLTSVLWPAWVWTMDPAHKFMSATFDATLAQRDAMAMRSIVRSDWYRKRWPDTQIDESGNTKDTQGVFFTNGGGFRYSTTVRGGATGWHAHTQIVDDPIKPSDIKGSPDSARTALESVLEWWKGTMASRKADPKRFARVLIMQRLHEADLAAYCVDDGYTHIMLPMRYEPARKCVTKWGADPRTEPGELLWPERFDEQSVCETEREMGSQVASAQLQQRPAPAEGNIFNRAWLLREWDVLPADCQYIQSWDLSFKDTATSDFVCGQVWAYSDATYYLVHQIHGRMGMPETIAAIKAMTKLYPRATAKLIEDKANGPAVEQMMRREMTGIIMVNPEGGKTARANAVAPLFEAGNVRVPKSPWIDAWREEMASFPFAPNDDRVDAATQALTYINGKSNLRYIQALKVIQKEVNGRR
jgi:predicted phage terminase large subunit-like protein